MYRRILVPLDGDEPAHLALGEALKLARDQQAHLRLVHVVDHRRIADGVMAIVRLPELIQAGTRVLTDAATLANEAGIKAETALLETNNSPVARVIADDARRWRADLIVMGTHGRRPLPQLVLGSCAAGVVRCVDLPVMLVHDLRGTRDEGRRQQRVPELA